MSIDSDTILRIPLTHCAVVVLSHKLQITILCALNYIYTDLRLDLLNDIYTIKQSLKNFSEEHVVNDLLYGSENFTLEIQTKIF